MNDPWYKSLGSILWGVFRFILAPFMAIGAPILATYGALHGSEADLNALQLRSTQIPVLIGIEGDSTDCSKYSPCTSNGQRTYLVFPEAITRGELVAVDHKDDIVTVDRQPLVGYLAIGIWLGFVGLTWRYCVRPLLPLDAARSQTSSRWSR
jgi:hypothetical protein